jgi:hypothetical protein
MMGRARVREPNRTALKTREKGEGECENPLLPIKK